MTTHLYPFPTSSPAVAAACDRQGVDCALQPAVLHRPAHGGFPDGGSGFTVVSDAKCRRMQFLADVGATVLIEAYARRELRSFGDSRNIYDVYTPDEEELPDEKSRDDMAKELDMAATYLTERGLIFRPWDDKPQLVAFVGRRA